MNSVSPAASTGPGSPSGLLHVELDYPLDRIEEGNDWYNNEHIPERLSVPGFVSGRRYAAIEGGPRWLALYELASTAVLETPAYRHYFAAGETVWTKRIRLGQHPNYRRSVYELGWSGTGKRPAADPPSGPPGLLSLRLLGPAPEPVSPALRTLASSPGVLEARLYAEQANPAETLFLAELSGIWVVYGPDFRRRWSDLLAALNEASLGYVRALYVRVL